MTNKEERKPGCLRRHPRLFVFTVIVVAALSAATYKYWRLAYAGLLYLDTVEHYSTGKPELAIALELRRAEEIKKVLGANNSFYGTALSNLGGLYAQIGEYARAEAYLREAGENLIRLGDTHSEAYLLILRNLVSSIYLPTNNLDQAKRVTQEQIRLLQEGVRTDYLRNFSHFLRYGKSFAVAIEPNCLADLGWICLEQGEYEEAKDYLIQARQAFAAAGPEYAWDVDSCDNMLGSAFAASGDLKQALEIHTRVADTVKPRFLKENADDYGYKYHASVYSTTLECLARTQFMRGEFKEARENVECALEALRRVYGDGTIDVLHVRALLLRVLAAQGDTAPAIELARAMLGSLEAFLSQGIQSATPTRKLEIFERTTYAQRVLYSTVFDGRLPDIEAAHLGFGMAIATKGRILEALAAEKRFAKQALDAEWSAAYEALNDLYRQYQELAFAHTAASGQDSRLYELQRQIDQAEHDLSAKNLAFAMDLSTRNADPAAIQQELAPHTALLEYVRFLPVPLAPGIPASPEPPAQYGCFLLESGAAHPVVVPLPDGESIDALVEAYRSEFAEQTRQRDFNEASEVRLGKIAHQIYTAAVLPVLGEIRDPDCRHIIVSADGSLQLIPFEVLVDAEPQPGELHYLAQSHALSYVNASRDIMSWGTSGASSATAPIIIGNPDFDASPQTILAAVERDSLEQSPLNRTPAEVHAENATPQPGQEAATLTFAGSGVDWYWQPLVAAGPYCENLATLLNTTTLYVGEQALEEVLKACESPRVLAIATHGFFLTDRENVVFTKSQKQASTALDSWAPPLWGNPLLNSGLLFSGANQPDKLTALRTSTGTQLNDGILTALEASSLNLEGTELVSLTACDTGLGEITVGFGVAGLRTAFIQAGSKSLLASLWQVPVEQTTKMAETFYHLWLIDGKSKLEAQHAAELMQLNQARTQWQCGHPIFWGGTILLGNPG